MLSARSNLYILPCLMHVLYSFPVITLAPIVFNENGNSCRPSELGLSQSSSVLPGELGFCKDESSLRVLFSCYLISTGAWNSITSEDNLYHSFVYVIERLRHCLRSHAQHLGMKCIALAIFIILHHSYTACSPSCCSNLTSRFRFTMPSTAIPLQFLGCWGYKDAELSAAAARNRDAALAIHPLASFILVTPEVAVNCAASLPPECSSLVLLALQSDQLFWVQKADIAKVLAVWFYGGFYADLADCTLVRSVDKLRSAGLVLCIGWNGAACEADILGGRKGDPRLLMLLHSMCESALGCVASSYSNGLILRTTGPRQWCKWAIANDLSGKPLCNRFAQVKANQKRAVLHEGKWWSTVTACKAPFWVVRHACSWIKNRKLLTNADLGRMAGATRHTVMPEPVNISRWNFCNGISSNGISSNSSDASQGLEASLGKLLQSTKSAATVDEVRLAIVRAMPTSFPEADFHHLDSAKTVDAALRQHGDARKSVLHGILASKTIPEHQRKLLVMRTKLHVKVVRSVARSLIKSKGQLKQFLKRDLKSAGRGVKGKMNLWQPLWSSHTTACYY